MNNFVFNHIDKFEYHKNTCDDISFNSTSHLYFDDDSINCLKANHRDSYQIIADNYRKKKTLFNIEKYHNDFLILYKSLVNNNGVIINHDKNIYLNGGCLCNNTNHAFRGKIQKEKNIISITALWADGIWHFPFEAFVALKSIPHNILNKCKIHVSKITPFIAQWFKLINISSSRLITGNVYADTIYLPRMGKCGNPYISQIQWLKNIVCKSLPNNNPKLVILIKRNYRRSLKNHHDLEKLLTFFCNKYNLKLYIHDDKNLPPLVEQHKIFNMAKYVFAPHGASGINIISMNPDSWYIEFLSNEDINICYSRLAYFSNVNYKAILMKNFTVDLNKVESTLNDF